MRFSEKLVSAVLTPEAGIKARDTEERFHINRMIASHGKWTLGKLYATLCGLNVVYCAKVHDEKTTGYEYCEHFGTNLVCGHIGNTQSIFQQPFRTAGSVIATSAYVAAHFGQDIADRYIPALNDFAHRSLKLDGAAYAAFRMREPMPPTHVNVPDSFRQPALEAISDIGELRLAIIGQEENLAPEILVIRDEVQMHLELGLDISDTDRSVLISSNLQA